MDLGICEICTVHLREWAANMENFHIIRLKGYDAILGMPWLTRTNPAIDWAK